MSQYIRHDEDFNDSSSERTDLGLPRPKLPNTSQSLFFESLNINQQELNDPSRPYSVYIDDTRLSQLMRTCNSSDTPSTDTDRAVTAESAYSFISLMDSRGSSSIKLQQGSPNDAPPEHFSPTHESGKSSISNEILNHSTGHPSHNMWAPGSVGTVSTSMLLNLNEETNDSICPPGQSNGSIHSRQVDETGVSSNFLPLKSFKLHPPDSASLTGGDHPTNTENEKTSSSYSSSSYPYDDQVEPNIEEAVKLLKREVGITSPQVNYVQPNFGREFKPHEYKLPRKISQTSLAIETDFSENLAQRKVPKAPHSPSLLNNILVPTVSDSNNVGIPALRAVSGNHKPLQSTMVKRNSAGLAGKFPGNFSTEKVLNVPQRARLARITKLTNSQVDMAVETLREYRNPQPYNDVPDLEVTAGRGLSTFSDTMPIQHIDSSSVRSYDSQKNTFLDIYSIPRMTCVLLCCLVIPPFFFMIAVGAKGGISNYRLMRMIMNLNHRVGLLKGFVWEIDVQWFRTLCLLLGSLETLCVLACIGVGFGVGLRNE